MASDLAEGRPLRLLVAERQGWFARTVGTVLEAAGWRVVRASDGARTLQFVGETAPDVVILHDDLEQPGAAQLCATLRALPSVGVVTPIIIVGSDARREQRVAALRAGAWHHVVQPLDPEEFLLRITTLAVARRELEHLTQGVLVDQQTGLYNHVGIERRAEEVEADTRRRRAPLSCVLFAPEPDEVRSPHELVAEVGLILRERGRGSDVIGRFDGVLAVIAPSTDAEGAARLAARLMNVIKESPHRRSPPDRQLRVRAAYCAAADFARSTLTVSEMLERAQTVLRRAPSEANGTQIVPGESVPLVPPA